MYNNDDILKILEQQTTRIYVLRTANAARTFGRYRARTASNANAAIRHAAKSKSRCAVTHSRRKPICTGYGEQRDSKSTSGTIGATSRAKSFGAGTTGGKPNASATGTTRPTGRTNVFEIVDNVYIRA